MSCATGRRALTMMPRQAEDRWRSRRPSASRAVFRTIASIAPQSGKASFEAFVHLARGEAIDGDGFGCAMKHGVRPYTDCVAGKPEMSRAIALAALISVRCVVAGRSSTDAFASVRRRIGWRQIGATASAQRCAHGALCRGFERCSKREPLIGVRFSDSSRDLHRGSRGARSAEPRDPRGFVRVKAAGVLDQD